MLHIKLDGLDFQNELMDLLQLFYREDEIVWREDEMGCREDGGSCCKKSIHGNENESPLHPAEFFLSGKLTCTNALPYYQIELVADGIHRVTGIPASGIHFVPEHNSFQALRGAGSDLKQRRLFKRELKRTLYFLLSDLTGKRLPWGMLTGIRPAKIVHEMLEEGMTQQAAKERLTGYYGIAPQKAELLHEVASVERAILERTSEKSVAIYIGIPFCTTRCLYCSFTSNSISRAPGLVPRYMDALKVEMEQVGRWIQSSGIKVQSIYIGGGTPTAIDESALRSMLAGVENCFDLSHLEEYTIEAGRPDSINEEKLRIMRESAATRISINPQTMNARTLEKIGRCHTPEDVAEAFKLARGMGFGNINMDLIIGLPGEDSRMFRNTLDRIREMSPESLTVHTMAIKRASRLNEELESHALISAEEAAEMVDMAYHSAIGMGMHPYYLYRQKNILGSLENVGYCRPGFESIYNVQIMEEKQTILALGAGAITKVVYPGENRIERAFNVKNVEEYISRIDEMLMRKWVLLDNS